MHKEESKDDAQDPGPITFQARLELEGKTATGFRVPPEVVAALGPGKRPPVRVTIGEHTYRSTVAAYGDVFMIGVSAENRAKAGVAAGDVIAVTLERDNEPREVEVPPDLMAALEQDSEAKRFFDSLSYSNKRRYVLSIADSKTVETRQRRIARVISALREKRV